MQHAYPGSSFQPPSFSHSFVLDRQPRNEDLDESSRARRQRTPSRSLSPGFDYTLRDELRDYNEARGLPISHFKEKLIEQARTRKPQRVVRTGRPQMGPRKAKKDQGNSAVVEIEEDILVDEDLHIEEQMYIDPGFDLTRSTANEPVVRDLTYHNHELSPPLVKEEPGS